MNTTFNKNPSSKHGEIIPILFEFVAEKNFFFVLVKQRKLNIVLSRKYEVVWVFF